MIEHNGIELSGQTELSDFLPKEAARSSAEGYDAEGHLLDYDPEAGLLAEVMGGATPDKAAPERAAAPQTSADIRLDALAGEINAITEHARVVLASAAIDIGRRLIEAKGLVPSGSWREWLEKHVDYSERQAQLMMQLADEYGRGELPEVYKGLGISHMTALLSAPEEQREALAERASDEGLSVRRLQEEIRRLKAENEDKQLTIDGLNDTQELLRKNLTKADEDARAAERAIRDEHQSAEIARGKADAAEETANALRREKKSAEEAARLAEQRAKDAVQSAKEARDRLAEAVERAGRAEARAAELEARPPERVEAVPEAVARELETLRRQLAEAKAGAQLPPERSPKGEGGATATEKFKWFYANQMKPAFSTALELLKEVAGEDAKAANLYATALVTGCRRLMDALGEGSEPD